MPLPKQLSREPLLAYTPSDAVADPVNLRILTELQSNPRLAVTERVRRLEESGVIRGYRMDLDPAALGLPIAAYIRIRPNSGQLPRIAELAREIPEVVECDRVTGEDC